MFPGLVEALLVAPTKSSPLLEPHYAAPSEFSHLRECRKQWLWQLTLLESLARSRNAFWRSKKSKSLTVIHVNARSLFRHFDNLTSLASAECPHIIAISETWLDSSVTNNEIRLTGYNLFRFNRNHSGGGVAVYCSDRLLCSLLSCGTFSTGVEFLWVFVRVGYFHPFLTFGCFYRPPVALSQSVHDIRDNVESMMLNNQHILACGDFNIDMFDLNKPLSQTFHHFITSHSLTQPIS